MNNQEEHPEQVQALDEPKRERLFCPRCGNAMDPDDRFCSSCGWDSQNPDQAPPAAAQRRSGLAPASQRSRLTALLLCILIGFTGAHRFYAGRTGSGVVWLLTFGVFFVGVIYDIVIIATGEFLDGGGNRLVHWE